MHYELTDLRLFVAIVDAHSLSSAASRLHITPSAASYRLRNLEQALETPLFIRASRGMELTPAGKSLLHHVRGLMAGIERMHEDVGSFSAGLKGHIRLLANTNSLNGFIIPSISSFLVNHPNVNIDLEERKSELIPQAIAQQEADIGIFAGTTKRTDLSIVQYAVDRMIVIAPVGHPLTTQPQIRLGEALNFDFICMSRSSYNFAFLREHAAELGYPLKVRIHVHAFDAVIALVEAGVGVALVPQRVAAKSLHEGRVTGIALSEPWARRELNLITRAAAKLPAFASAFINFLLDPALLGTSSGVYEPSQGEGRLSKLAS